MIIRRRKVRIEIEHRSLTVEAFAAPAQRQPVVPKASPATTEIRSTPHADAAATTHLTLPEEAL